MKNRILLILLVLALAVSLKALEISAEILDPAAEPVENVIISFNGKTILSDPQGRFLIKNIQSNTTLSLKKIGFRERKYMAEDVPARIYLEFESIPVEGIVVTADKQKEFILPNLPTKKFQIYTEFDKGQLADLLRQEAGLQIQGNSLTGERQNVVIPGFKARHTLVLLDGVPLNQPGEAYDISALPRDMIEEIEIYDKSAFPSGSGSLGGIINFVTRKTGSNSIRLNGGIGSFGLVKSGADLSLQVSSFALNCNYSLRTARNNFLYEPEEYWENPDSLRTRKFNDKKLQDVNFSLKNYRFPLSYSFIYQDFFKKLPGPTNNPQLYANGRITGSSQRHTISLESNISQFQWNSTISYNIENSSYDNTRIEEIYTAYYVKNKTKYSNLDIKNTVLSRSENLDLGLVAYYQRQTFKYLEFTDPDNSIDLTQKNNIALSAFLDRRFDLFPFTLNWHSSLRSDYMDDDQQYSYLVMPSLKFSSSVDLILGASLGRSFTVPSFYDLYWKGDTQATGNPQLKPETGDSRQVFLKVEHDFFNLEINYRQDDIKDMIIWLPDFNKTWKPLNIAGAEVRNLTLSGDFQPCSFLELDCVYNSTRTADRSLNSSGEHSSYWGKDLIYTPEYLLNTNLKISYKELRFRLNYNRTGAQWISRDQLSDSFKLPEFDLWNTDLQYNFKLAFMEVGTGLRLKNIANKYYEIYEYSPQPGFNWEFDLNLKYEFNHTRLDPQRTK